MSYFAGAFCMVPKGRADRAASLDGWRFSKRAARRRFPAGVLNELVVGFPSFFIHPRCHAMDAIILNNAGTDLRQELVAEEGKEVGSNY